MIWVFVLTFFLYLASGPLIKWILTLMSETKFKSTDHIGMLIGYIERLLILIFFVLKEYTAIGLVIASKSILRFNDLKDDTPNLNPDKVDKKSEYILLGTMLSLLFGVLLGLLLHLGLPADTKK
ncbi:hypothetical protein [Macrococcus sp. DPC7161]|uniref:hypothetical protein n=1 Tax=Macrococcus sp. DPC7161 TaxID=2507060 RepID=UPI00100BAA78|nr:hypothetical protein [Macrococcus sp. DPC7161]RXK19195.1 hypothetical protein ER639_02440 [Macrococcus sp. DPC7161]